MKKSTVIAGMFLLSWTQIFAQSEVLSVMSPSAWMTLRTDSVEVSFQADAALLPQNSVALKVSRNSGGRASVLFSKTVKVEEGSADVYLGRVRDLPLGGSDFISVEWSVPGAKPEIRGVIEPVGIVVLDSTAIAKKPTTLSAVKLSDGVTEEQAVVALAAADAVGVGVKFTAGWNKEALFILIDAGSNAEVQVAIDGKCGKGAFLSWADRFIVYSAENDSVYGVHYKRSIDIPDTKASGRKTLKYDAMSWGDETTISMTKTETSRLIKIKWYDIGLQPFDERNVGFAVYTSDKSKRVRPVFPSTAKREIPGTWGDIRLEK